MEPEKVSELNGANQSIEPERNSKVIIEKEFDSSKADYEFKQFFKEIPSEDEDSRLFYFTDTHIGTKSKMGFFGDFAPSVVFATNRFNGQNLPVRETYLQEFGASKLCHLYCTLDKSVMFNFQNRHMAKSKVHNLNSVAAIFHREDLQIEDDILKQKEVPDDQIISVLFKIKKNCIKLFNEVEVRGLGYAVIEQTPHEFGYPSMLEKIVGVENLTKVLLYGSSACGAGNDFDNFGVLHEVPNDLYLKIKGTKPSEAGKDVGVIFIPESILENFLYVNVSNSLFRKNARSLKGEFKVPIESTRYQLFKEKYHAGFGSAKLISGLNLVYRRPDIFFDKPGLFDYFMKLNRFTLQGLSQKEKYRILSKDEVMDQLKQEFNFELPSFKADSAYLQECFLKANEASVNIAKKLYNPGLVAEKNEHLVELKEQVSRRIFRADYNRLDLYVFGGRESMRVGDVVPVKILNRKDKSYISKRRELHYRGISFPQKLSIGRRV
jgi:hypothetical protein